MRSQPIDIPQRSRPVATWVRDSAANMCTACGEPFRFFLRRHHCRLCGRIFCHACASNYDTVPPQMLSMIPSSPPTLCGFVLGTVAETVSRGVLAPTQPGYADRPRRLCNSCHDSVVAQRGSERLARVLDLVMDRWFQIGRRCMATLACVSQGWGNVARLNLQKFHRMVAARIHASAHAPAVLARENLPIPPPTPPPPSTTQKRAPQRKTAGSCVVVERQIMRASLTECAKAHPHALARLVASHASTSTADPIPKGIEAHLVRCLGAGSLSPETALMVLDTVPRVNEARFSSLLVLATALRSAATRALLPSSAELAAPYLTRAAFMHDEDTLRCFAASRDAQQQFDLYWILRVYRPAVAAWMLSQNPLVAKEIAATMRLIELIQESAQHAIKSSSSAGGRAKPPHKFRARRRKKRKHAPAAEQKMPLSRALDSRVRAWRRETKDSGGVLFPGIKGRRVVDIYPERAKTKPTSTLPAVVPVLLGGATNGNGGEPAKTVVDVLVKRESVLNDRLMMDCLSVFHKVLTRESPSMGWLLNIVWYGVVPLSRTSGLVVMVPRSRSLHGITQTGLSLQNYLLEHNPGSSVHNLRLGFIRSCAVCCIQSMLFGLGDRHLDNILMTERGQLFHVDYSYLFGREPSGKQILAASAATCMKLTPSVVDIMGGQHSNYFDTFRRQSTEIYNILRKHANTFARICEPLVRTGQISEAAFLEHLHQTFRPGQSVAETTVQIENIIEYNTRHRLLDGVLDRLHNTCAVFF